MFRLLVISFFIILITCFTIYPFFVFPQKNDSSIDIYRKYMCADINTVINNFDSVLIIQPNYIREDSAFKSSFKKIQDNYLTNVFIVSDTTVKNHDLSRYSLILYGSTENNSFLKKMLLSTPFNLDDNLLKIDTVYSNDSLMLIAEWYNPYNPLKDLLFFVSTQNIELIDFLKDIDTQNAQFVIAENYKVRRKGFYKLINKSITFSDKPDTSIYKNVQLKPIGNKSLYFFPDDSLIKNNSIDNFINTKQITNNNKPDLDSTFLDMNWLEEVAKNNKFIFIGENHYFSYINDIASNIILTLNNFSNFPFIVIENEFSCTEYFNYYIRIVDDKKADSFFSTELKNLISTVEDKTFLENIRKFNISHSNKSITIGCSDIDHNYKSLCKNIILPYLAQIDSSVLNIDTLLSNNSALFFNKIDSVSNIAKIKKLNGNYSFITWDYINRVINSIKQAVNAYNILENKGYNEFNNFRQQSIITNLTDTNYLGKYITNNTVFYGGSYHMATYNMIDTLSEAYFFSNKWEYSKGRTYGIRILGLSYIFRGSENISCDVIKTPKQLYRLICNTKPFIYDKSINLNTKLFIFSEIDSFLNSLLNISKQYNYTPFLITKIDWFNIENIVKLNSKKDYHSFKFLKNDFTNFDKVIIVPFSPFSHPF